MAIKPPELFDGITGEVWSARKFYNLIKSENWIAYIGSGVAASAHETWDELIKGLCVTCDIEYTYEDLNSDDGKLVLADRAFQKNEELFKKYLYEKFGDYNLNTSTAYSPIMNLPFKSFMTTNYDNGPCSFNTNLRVNIYPDIRHKDINSKAIFYLHGKIDGPNFDISRIVLGKESYRIAYEESRLKFVLPTLFLEENIIVFGARFRETPLRKIISEANNIKNCQVSDSVLKNELIIILNSAFSFDQLNAPIIINEHDLDENKEDLRNIAKQQEKLKQVISEYSSDGFQVLCYEAPEENHTNFNNFLKAVQLEHQQHRPSWSQE